jgi:hypothetical protein
MWTTGMKQKKFSVRFAEPHHYYTVPMQIHSMAIEEKIKTCINITFPLGFVDLLFCTINVENLKIHKTVYCNTVSTVFLILVGAGAGAIT